MRHNHTPSTRRAHHAEHSVRVIYTYQMVAHVCAHKHAPGNNVCDYPLNLILAGWDDTLVDGADAEPRGAYSVTRRARGLSRRTNHTHRAPLTRSRYIAGLKRMPRRITRLYWLFIVSYICGWMVCAVSSQVWLIWSHADRANAQVRSVKTQYDLYSNWC